MKKFIGLSFASAMLLSGCVTYDRAYYDDGRGDYYYGRPSTVYQERYYSPYYGGNYRYYNSYPYSYGYYGSPGYRYYPHRYSRPYYRPYPGGSGHHRPHPGDGHRPPRGDAGGSPWKNLEKIRPAQQPDRNYPRRDMTPGQGRPGTMRPIQRPNNPPSRPGASPRPINNARPAMQPSAPRSAPRPMPRTGGPVRERRVEM